MEKHLPEPYAGRWHRPCVRYSAMLLVTVCLGIAMSQPSQAQNGASAADRPLDLVGNRFRALEYEELSSEQRALVESILAGPRNALGGPFNVLLRSPEMGDLAQKLGAYARFDSSLSDALRELAISMTARFWTAEFEWYAHSTAALEAGVAPEIVEAIETGRRPSRMQAEEQAVYDFTSELLGEHHVTDATYEAALAALGERGVVDLIGTIGYYSLVSMLLNVDEYPLPEGVEPAFR